MRKLNEIMELNLDLPPEIPKIHKKTPKETKRIRQVTIQYEDDSSLTLVVEDEQGFHRESDYQSADGKTMLCIHEVFITYGYPRAS